MSDERRVADDELERLLAEEAALEPRVSPEDAKAFRRSNEVFNVMDKAHTSAVRMGEMIDRGDVGGALAADCRRLADLWTAHAEVLEFRDGISYGRDPARTQSTSATLRRRRDYLESLADTNSRHCCRARRSDVDSRRDRGGRSDGRSHVADR